MSIHTTVTLLSDDQVTAVGNALLARADRETVDMDKALEARVIRPLVTAARSGVAAHEAARDALLASGWVTWRGIVAYRDAVEDRILAPLLQTLERTRPADRIRTSLWDLRRSLREAAAAHPGLLTACDPPEFYNAAPGDPSRVRWLKRWVRLRRRAGAVADGATRFLGRSPRGECQRNVPLRQFWRSHVDDRLGSRHYLRHEELQLLWARPWVHLLHASTILMEAVLLLDQAHDSPGLHLPADTSGAVNDTVIPDPESGVALEAIAQFHQALEGLVTLALSPAPSTADAAEVLRRSLVLAGTPLLPRAWRPGDHAPIWVERLEARGREWDQWALRGDMELRALVTRVRFRQALSGLADQLLTRIHRETVQPLAERVDRPGTQLQGSRDASSNPSIDLGGIGRVERALEHLGANEDRRIDGLINQLPGEVVPISATGAREVDPVAHPAPWSPRDAAREAFQPSLTMVLGDAALLFRDRVITVWAMVRQGPPADALARAVEDLEPAWQHLAQTIWKAVDAHWTDFQRRVRRATADRGS